ncbi:mask, partial [Symbiodinium sp. CCMP2456]
VTMLTQWTDPKCLRLLVDKYFMEAQSLLPHLCACRLTGHAEVVELLMKAGADRTLVSKEGKTAFMEASSWGHIEVMRLLKPLKRKRMTRPAAQR